MRKTSKWAIAGEPICDFIKRGHGTTSVWLADSQENANKLMKQIGASAIKYKLKPECQSWPVIASGKYIKFVLVAYLEDPLESKLEELKNERDGRMVGE